MLSREEEQNKIQRQLHFLQWGARDITVRALHEAFRRTELPGFTGEAVQDMINQVLEKLEESPFRMPNYASKTSGAAIVRSKTSPSWTGSGKVFWQSLLVTPYMRAPEIILEPDNHPGNCWPFPGSQGHVVIKLPMAIFPTAVTLNHGIPAAAYRADSISSAPKDFAVYGSDTPGLWGFCLAFEVDGGSSSKSAAACSPSLPWGRKKFLRVAPFPQHSFSVQHSAAKKGLKAEDEEEGIFLGEFTFVPGQAPSQTFQLKERCLRGT